MNYYISDLHLFHKNVTRTGKDFDEICDYKDFFKRKKRRDIYP